MIAAVVSAMRRRLSLDRQERHVLLARVLQSANGFLLSIILVRQYGLAAAGTYALAGVAIGALAILCTFGLPYSLARSEAPISERNALGAAAGLVMTPLALPFIAVYALMLGSDIDEAAVIGAFALSGLFFAQTAIFNALLVLQNRAALSVLPQAFSTLTLFAGAAFTDSLLEFATTVGLARTLGLTMCFVLPHSPVNFRSFFAHARKSSNFMPFELLHLASDQIFTVLLSFVLTRETLGIFGLWRQLFNVGMLAPSSMIQASYPEIVRQPGPMLLHLRRKISVVAILSTGALALMAIPLGTLVYNAPSFPILTLLLVPCLPLGCLVVLYDMGMRALNSIGIMNRIGLLRCAALFSVVPMAHLGTTGLAIGIDVYTAFSALVTLRAFAAARARHADVEAKPVMGNL
jgi:O-antigen/teichoic acid export membrane protein